MTIIKNIQLFHLRNSKNNLVTIVKFHSKQNTICIKNEITKALRGVHPGPKYNAIFLKNNLLYTLEHIFWNTDFMSQRATKDTSFKKL